MKIPPFILPVGLCVLGNTLLAGDEWFGPTMELPPMVVTSNQGLVWRHAEMPGYEILSCCSDAMTTDFMIGLARSETLLQLLVPKEYWARSDVPRVIILSRPENLALMPRELLGEDDRNHTLTNRGDRLNLDGSRVIPNLELGDQDGSMVFATLDAQSFDPERFIMHPAHVRRLLLARRPPWPDWLVTGVANLYAGLYAATESATAHEYVSSPAQQLLSSTIAGTAQPRSRRVTLAVEVHALKDTFSVPALEWISEPQTRSLLQEKAGPKSDRTPAALAEELKRFLPLPALLARPPAPDSADWPAWNAQATLFVRWAVGGESPARKEAFWRFVAGLGEGESVDEGKFRAAFGLGFDQALVELNDYLRVAIKHPIDLELPKSRPAVPQIQPASETDILRIKEDWTRLVAAYLKARSPEATALDRRHRAALRACENGNKDPRLLAAVGLYETELGHETSALAWLEEAAGAKVVQPRVYYELARLRYARRRNFDGSPLRAGDAAYAAAPLRTGFNLNPPRKDSYALAVEIWLHSEGAPTADEMQLLDRGLELFPEDLDLLYGVARLNSRQGRKAEALRLADRGIKSSPYPEMRARFEALRSNQGGGRPP